ncbi:uncharacterized protein LOC105380803 isoform X1 [Plutella xylostella]|uniref:uncharacterized protein LOC105380803 isoform X1 n=1 Tax=Plutella xylostella TaxID=51655 RepID=UPI002032251B|nr:uncharacterized protein LOC105380803 isoform X1 [Plutella xylostella]
MKLSDANCVNMMSVAGVVVLALALGGARGARGGAGCGGHLQGPHGVIQTPNFPDAFPVPIRCKWVISHATPNGTISIYFTQQYTTTGLTFTEYMYYDDTYRRGERKAFTVTDENITRVKWLQVQSPVLVVELSLDTLEGTQLRALGLLSVFGLNITYAVTPPPAPGPPPPSPPASSCSAVECRLLGHCYANSDYQQFYCSCFEGYSGADCGAGPLCAPNMCMNGGVCRQMGPAAVSCICPAGFAGDLCEAQVLRPECGIEECSEGCTGGSKCDCSPRDSDSTSARYETKLLVMDRQNANLTQEIIEQVTLYLKESNITLDDDIEILDISPPDAQGARSVAVRVWAPRRAAGAMRVALSRLVAVRTRASERMRLLPTTLQFTMQPALSFHALTLNQRSEIWEGSEFILSCTAYGSPGITFTWYKDGNKINFNGTTRDIWTRTVAEDALGRRISVLGISEAKQMDSGQWSCAADDAGRRRCGALRLRILKPPEIRLLPSTLTVNKGDNVSVTCLAGASRVHGALGFSWTVERTLLPFVPGREVWEDLYPAGSVLKLYNIQKSGEYRCQVSSIAGTNAKGVTLWVIKEDDGACKPDASHGLHWPRTAPGAYASAPCPPGYTGDTIRFCESDGVVKWKQPDFSGCIAESLKNIHDLFTLVSYGYSRMEVSNIIHQYGSILRSLPIHPGGGVIPFEHAREMLNYLRSHAVSPKDRAHSVEYLMKIFNTLLKHHETFLEDEKIPVLQTAIAETASMQDYVDLSFREFTVLTKPIHESHPTHFKLQDKVSDGEKWTLLTASEELLQHTGNATAIAVMYTNLEARLPYLVSAVENKYENVFTSTDKYCCRDGRKLDYHLVSPQLQVLASGTEVDTTVEPVVTLLFSHTTNISATTSRLACAYRVSSELGLWSTSECDLSIPEPNFVSCYCKGFGTYALFTVASSTFTGSEEDLRGIVKIATAIGSAICLLVGVLQFLGLFTTRKERLTMLLKAVTAGTHSAAILMLLECDARQEACPGVWGWVCAACWCAGCAALCAQPLLLQAELAGRPQNAPTVGLLSGVCIMIWLTARLCGGAPLHIGSSAHIVCATGCILLLILGFSLSVCALLRIRSITHEIPLQKRNYLRDRRKEINHTLVLLVTTTLVMVAGVSYVQPGESKITQTIIFALAVIINAIAMVVCYVAFDDECLKAAKRMLFIIPNRKWDDSRGGNTSLGLYSKQSAEDTTTGSSKKSTSKISPVSSYWRAGDLESPLRIQRWDA